MTYQEYITADTGYQTMTTFWDDFSIAEHFGMAAIKDTFKRAFNGWKDNVEYITELCLILNHKIWYFYDRGNRSMSSLYDELWREVDGWCMEHLMGDDLKYFLEVTD